MVTTTGMFGGVKQLLGEKELVLGCWLMPATFKVGVRVEGRLTGRTFDFEDFFLLGIGPDLLGIGPDLNLCKSVRRELANSTDSLFCVACPILSGLV